MSELMDQLTKHVPRTRGLKQRLIRRNQFYLRTDLTKHVPRTRGLKLHDKVRIIGLDRTELLPNMFPAHGD